MFYSLFLIVLLHNIILCISVLPELTPEKDRELVENEKKRYERNNFVRKRIIISSMNRPTK